VSFKPAAYVDDTTANRIASVGTGAATLGVFGTTQSPAKLTLSPAPTTFGQVVAGTTSTAQSFTVTNVGQTASAAVSVAIAAGSGTNPQAGLFVAGGNCAAILPPGGTCVGTIAAAPATTIGAFSATLQVTDGTVNTGAPIALTATGVFDTTLSLSVTSLTFASQAVGTSATTTVTVTNAANAKDSGVLAIAVADTTNFAVVLGSAGGTCGALINATTPVGLAAGASCTVGVTFKPQALAGTGALPTTLTVTGTPGGTKTLPITATAISGLTITGSGVSAGAVVSAAPLTVTVTLVAGSAVKDTAFLKTSISGSSYYITNDECVANVLSAGDSCQITINFVATAATPLKTGTLTVNGGTPGASASLVLNSVAP
jgi:hypothetical protein